MSIVQVGWMGDPWLQRAVAQVVVYGRADGTWAPTLTVPDEDTAVLYIGRTPMVAFAAFYQLTTPGRWWLDLLWTHPEHRRKGHAWALMGRLVSRIESERGTRLLAGVGHDNQVMQKLLRHRSHDGRQPDRWSPDHTVYATEISADADLAERKGWS